MKTMEDNDVSDLVKLLEGAKLIGCKWIFKTKRDSNDNIERYKARLVTKGFCNTPNYTLVVYYMFRI